MALAYNLVPRVESVSKALGRNEKLTEQRMGCAYTAFRPMPIALAANHANEAVAPAPSRGHGGLSKSRDVAVRSAGVTRVAGQRSRHRLAQLFRRTIAIEGQGQHDHASE